MQAISSFIVTLAGVIAAPFAVAAVHEPLAGGPAFVPYALMLVCAGLVAVIESLRPAAIGFAFGVLLYIGTLKLFPGQIGFLPRGIPPPF